MVRRSAFFGLVLGLLIGTSVVVLTPVAANALPPPAMVYPSQEQGVPYSDSLYVRVEPVAGASGYLFGFFQNGTMVWENNTDEHVLSGPEYAIPAGSAAHQALQPGDLQIWVRAYVDDAWTDAAITDVTLVPFYCMTGPGGSCNGGGPVTRPPSTMTWNEYLTWLDDLASGVQQGGTLLSCTAGALHFDLGASCLKLIADRFLDNPALSAALGALLCAAGLATGLAITGCLGTGMLAVRAVIWSIREAAKHDPAIARFLASPITGR